jgi:hypothetical protein
MHFAGSYHMQVAVFLAMVLFAVYSRGLRAWIFAFLSGGVFPELFIFHWLKFKAVSRDFSDHRIYHTVDQIKHAVTTA